MYIELFEKKFWMERTHDLLCRLLSMLQNRIWFRLECYEKSKCDKSLLGHKNRNADVLTHTHTFSSLSIDT